MHLTEAEARKSDFLWSAGMVIGLAFVFFVLLLFRGVGVPVLLAMVIAYGLNPIVTALERKGIPRAIGCGLAFLGGAMIATGFALYLIPVLRAEAVKLPEFFRQATTQIGPWIEKMTGYSLPELIRQRTAEIGNEASRILQSAGPAVAGILAVFAGNTARLLATVLGLLVVPVIAFFFLKDYPLLIERARALLPRRTADLVSARFREVDEVLSAFVRGQLIVGTILSIIYAAGFSAARIEMAIVIGMITGFGNMVPYLGTAMGILFSTLGLVLSWKGSWQIFFVIGTFAFALLAEGLFITPRIVGNKVGLPPVAVIIAVLGFGELFGFVGVLLAVPTSAILKVVLKVVIQRYQKTGVYLGSQSEP
jgi:predicted PurR-regulated permease PerM